MKITGKQIKSIQWGFKRLDKIFVNEIRKIVYRHEQVTDEILTFVKSDCKLTGIQTGNRISI